MCRTFSRHEQKLQRFLNSIYNIIVPEEYDAEEDFALLVLLSIVLFLARNNKNVEVHEQDQHSPQYSLVQFISVKNIPSHCRIKIKSAHQVIHLYNFFDISHYVLFSLLRQVREKLVYLILYHPFTMTGQSSSARVSNRSVIHYYKPVVKLQIPDKNVTLTCNCTLKMSCNSTTKR